MSTIKDWDTFHDTFATTLGFPDFYGRNMNAWIACLTYEDDGMSAFPVASGEVLTLRLQDCKEFRLRCPEIYEGLIDAAAFVNWRCIDIGDMSILTLAFRYSIKPAASFHARAVGSEHRWPRQTGGCHRTANPDARRTPGLLSRSQEPTT